MTFLRIFWHATKAAEVTIREDMPGEPTIRRTLKTIDAGEVDRIIGHWLSSYGKGEAIAIDGKTV